MKIYSLLLLLSLNLYAETFKQGTGSRYKMVSENGATADLSIYISESSFTQLGVEYFFSTDGIDVGASMSLLEHDMFFV